MTRCIEYGDEITSTSTDIKPSAMELIGKGRCEELYNQAFKQHNEDFEEKIGQILQTTNFIYENSKSIISLEYWLYPAIGVITFAYLSEYLAPILTIIICGGLLFRFFHIQGLQATYSTGLTSSFTSLHSSPKKDVRLLGIVLCIECYLGVIYDPESASMVIKGKSSYRHFSQLMYSSNTLSVKEVLLAYHKSQDRANKKYEALVEDAVALSKNSP